MAFCIMRTQKLKSVGGVCASISHSYRKKETPNADLDQTKENWYSPGDYQQDENGKYDYSVADNKEWRDKMADQAIAKFKKELPEKIRKNAVVGVELLMTFSPEWKDSPNYSPIAYLNACDKWAAQHFGGKKNVICKAHHFDETTPHTSIIIIPKDEKGKLNCRSFIGGNCYAMSQLQDSFYEEVGKQFGLDRGLRGSKAKHQDIKKFYGAVEQTKKDVYDISAQIAEGLPKKTFSEGNRAYTEKVRAQIAHDLTPIVAKHLNAPSEAKHTRALNRSLALTLERTKEETRQSVTQEVTQALNDKYNEDLEEAVKERTEKQAEDLRDAKVQLRRFTLEKIERAQKERKEKKEKEKEERERKIEKARIEQEHQKDLQAYEDILYQNGVITFTQEGETEKRWFTGAQCLDEEGNIIDIKGGVAYAARLADQILGEASPEWFYNCYKLMLQTQQTTLENAIVVKDRPFEDLQAGDVFNPAVFEIQEDIAGKWLIVSDPRTGLTRKAQGGAYDFFTKDFMPESVVKGSKYTIDEMQIEQYQTPEGLQTDVKIHFTKENLAQDEKPRKENEPRVLELKLDIKEEKKKQLELEKKNTLHR